VDGPGGWDKLLKELEDIKPHSGRF